jgi:hypothetical protein
MGGVFCIDSTPQMARDSFMSAGLRITLHFMGAAYIIQLRKSLQGSLTNISILQMVYANGIVEIDMKGSTGMVSEVVKGSINTQMEVSMWGSSPEE